MQSVFVDEVMAMSLSPEGIVQIRLGLKSIGGSDDKKISAETLPVIHLSLSLKGFLNMFEGQEKIMKKLLEDGVIKKLSAADE